MGTAIEVGDIGASFIAALADKKVGQWIEIPLGLADDKPIVYSLYVPPENHWRDVFTKTGGFVMGFPGEAAGTAVGAFTSPITGPVGPVVGNVAGGKIGGDIGEGVVGFIYDSLVPKADVPQNPHSNMIESGTMQIGNQQGVYVNSTDGADVIDLARLIKPDDGEVSTQVVYTISPEGKTHLEVITSSTF
ncbi:MAG: hypothetical protein IPN29_02340 [Saprospiraceae bacterium]|nr:hypothetical protein [Saprospiraceae bacterium]